jgi:hypothetical protein
MEFAVLSLTDVQGMSKPHLPKGNPRCVASTSIDFIADHAPLYLVRRGAYLPEWCRPTQRRNWYFRADSGLIVEKTRQRDAPDVESASLRLLRPLDSSR